MTDRICSTADCGASVPAHSSSDQCMEHRFWSHVRRSLSKDACWTWMAARDWDGYGIFTAEARRTIRAHRWAYEHIIGAISDGMHLDHLCRNRACVNPTHLEPVTSRVNTMRGQTLAAANAAKTHCANGHPFSGRNLRVLASGKRCCRECGRQATARYRIRRSAS